MIDVFGNLNIFSTQKCSFQQNLSDKSRENANKNHDNEPLISLIILAT